MSEQEHEPDDADLDLETDEETDEEEHAEEQTPAEAADAEGSAEIAAKLKTATQSYHTRIVNLLGREMEEKICPTCDGFGFYDGPPPTPASGELPSDFVHPENYVTCSACNGYGEILSGSKNPLHAVVSCTACANLGYRIETPAQPMAPVVPIAQPQAPHSQMGTLMPDGTFIPFGTTTPAPATG